MKQLVHLLLLALAWGCINAADIPIAPGTDTLTNALSSPTLSDGDTLILGTGLYDITQPTLPVEKSLKIVGVPGTELSFGAPSSDGLTGFVFSGSGLSTSVQNVTFRRGAGSCSLFSPQPLNASFSISVLHVGIANNRVQLKTDLGPWYHTRHVTGVNFGTCTITPTGASPAIAIHSLVLSATTCRMSLMFDVTFSRLMSCGPTKSTSARFVSYLADVNANMTETVRSGNNSLALRVGPVNRTANAVLPLRMIIDRERSVSAAIAVNTDYNIKIQAVITRAEFDPDRNTTMVDVMTVMPYPYVSLTGATGVLVPLSTVQSVNVTGWRMLDPACSGLTNKPCAQKLTFNISGCMITGNYQIRGLPVTCQTADCIVPSGTTANVSISLDSRDMCLLDTSNLGKGFDSNIQIWKDPALTVPIEPGTSVNLGTDMYFSVSVTPSTALGIAISDAELLSIERSPDLNPLPNVTGGGCAGANVTVQATNQTARPGGGLQLTSFVPLTSEVTCLDAVRTDAPNTTTLFTESDFTGLMLQLTPGTEISQLSLGYTMNISSVVICGMTLQLFPEPNFGGNMVSLYARPDGMCEYITLDATINDLAKSVKVFSPRDMVLARSVSFGSYYCGWREWEGTPTDVILETKMGVNLDICKAACAENPQCNYFNFYGSFYGNNCQLLSACLLTYLHNTIQNPAVDIYRKFATPGLEKSISGEVGDLNYASCDDSIGKIDGQPTTTMFSASCMAACMLNPSCNYAVVYYNDFNSRLPPYGCSYYSKCVPVAGKMASAIFGPDEPPNVPGTFSQDGTGQECADASVYWSNEGRYAQKLRQCERLCLNDARCGYFSFNTGTGACKLTGFDCGSRWGNGQTNIYKKSPGATLRRRSNEQQDIADVSDMYDQTTHQLTHTRRGVGSVRYVRAATAQTNHDMILNLNSRRVRAASSKGGVITASVVFNMTIRVDYDDALGAQRRRRRDVSVRTYRQTEAEGMSPSSALDKVSTKVGIIAGAAIPIQPSANVDPLTDTYEDPGPVLTAAIISVILLFLGAFGCTSTWVWVFFRLRNLQKRQEKTAVGATSSPSVFNGVASNSALIDPNHSSCSSSLSSTRSQSTTGVKNSSHRGSLAAVASVGIVGNNLGRVS